LQLDYDYEFGEPYSIQNEKKRNFIEKISMPKKMERSFSISKLIKPYLKRKVILYYFY